MIEEQATSAVIVALISEKNKSRENRKKSIVCVKPWVKRRKNLDFYETLLAELWLEYEYNYDILLRMTSENFEKIFQLIKDDMTKENTKKCNLQPQLAFYVYDYYSFYSFMNSSTFTSFRAFVFSTYFSLIKKDKSPDLSAIH